MDSNAILHEVRQLYNISDRLHGLAEKHPRMAEALLGISGSVRNTGTLRSSGCHENAPYHRAGSSKHLTLLHIPGDRVSVS